MENEKSISQKLIESIDYSWKIYDNNLFLCKEFFDEESVHNLRVSIRRIQSLLELLQQVCPSVYLQRAKKILKKQFKLFNPLRDLQVQILFSNKHKNKFETLPHFINYLTVKESLMIDNLKKEIADISAVEIEGNMLLFKMYFKEFSKSHQIDNAYLVGIFKNIEDDLLLKKSQINFQDYNTIHKFRLAFKNYRYVQEFFKLLGIFEEINIRLLKNFQNIMGKIQDGRVFQRLFKNFIFETGMQANFEISKIDFFVLDKRVLLVDNLSVKLKELKPHKY